MKARNGKAAETALKVTVPDEFMVSGVADNAARNELVRLLDGLGTDRSGHDKAVRALIPDAWRLHLRGGGATADSEKLAVLQMRRDELVGCRSAIAARGLSVAEIESTISALDRDMQRLCALIEAGGDAAADDQKSRQARTVQAAHDLEEVRARLAPFRAAQIWTGESAKMEEEEFRLEQLKSAADEAFAEGRAELERLSERVQGLVIKALSALCACGATACRNLGAQASALVMPEKLAFLVANPHRAPVEVEHLYRQAAAINALMERLDSRPGRGLAAFWSGTGAAEGVIAARCGLQYALPHERGRGRHAAAIMERVY